MIPDDVRVFERNWRLNCGAQVAPRPFVPIEGALPKPYEGSHWKWRPHPAHAFYVERFLNLAAAHQIPVYWVLTPAMSAWLDRNDEVGTIGAYRQIRPRPWLPVSRTHRPGCAGRGLGSLGVPRPDSPEPRRSRPTDPFRCRVDRSRHRSAGERFAMAQAGRECRSMFEPVPGSPGRPRPIAGGGQSSGERIGSEGGIKVMDNGSPRKGLRSRWDAASNRSKQPIHRYILLRHVPGLLDLAI